jgi:hypothetical protein
MSRRPAMRLRSARGHVFCTDSSVGERHRMDAVSLIREQVLDARGFLAGTLVDQNG